jgi:hypothetical protein
MTVVTPQQYREQTGDTTHFWSEIATWLASAQELVESALQRLLESEERTETMRAQASRTYAVLYPAAWPVTVVPDGYATEYDGRRIRTRSTGWDMLIEPWDWATEPVRTLTYTGGYTSATLPAALRAAIIDVARLGAVAGLTGPYPANASSVRLGDAAVTFFDASAQASDLLEQMVPGLAGRLRPWRRQT